MGGVDRPHAVGILEDCPHPGFRHNPLYAIPVFFFSYVHYPSLVLYCFGLSIKSRFLSLLVLYLHSNLASSGGFYCMVHVRYDFHPFILLLSIPSLFAHLSSVQGMYMCAEGACARTDTGLLPVSLFPRCIRDSPLRG